MNILVAGGTGFVGQHLIPKLKKLNHNITILGRDREKIYKIFGKKAATVDWKNLDKLNPDLFDAVINLSGRNIGEGRWTEKYKHDIISSRVKTTEKLARWCAKSKKKPHLYNASAIGVYGLQPLSENLPEAFKESSPIIPGDYSDFLSEVGQRWEAATESAIEAGVPVTIMRFAVILKRNQAVLKKLQLSFFLGLGGKVGTGTQPFTWIHIDDLTRAIIYLLNNPDITGPVNLCAPECVEQQRFASTLASVMHRPCFLTMPSWLLKTLFGEMADELLLKGQNVYPERLLQRGYNFSYPTLRAALEHDFNS